MQATSLNANASEREMRRFIKQIQISGMELQIAEHYTSQDVKKYPQQVAPATVHFI